MTKGTMGIKDTLGQSVLPGLGDGLVNAAPLFQEAVFLAPGGIGNMEHSVQTQQHHLGGKGLKPGHNLDTFVGDRGIGGIQLELNAGFKGLQEDFLVRHPNRAMLL